MSRRYSRSTVSSKKIPSYFPDWIKTTDSPTDEGVTRQALVNNKSTLIYLANQACISFHLSLAKIDRSDYPSYLIFDLDPSIPDLKLLKSVVMWTKNLMDQLNLTCFLQTTGSRGFHIYVPLKREVTFDNTRALAKECAQHLVKEHPKQITTEYSKDKRGNKILIDYARNTHGYNNIAPYSLRPLENAPIATPLHWDELNERTLNSQSYTIKNISKRLEKIANPWEDIFKHQNSLKKLFG